MEVGADRLLGALTAGLVPERLFRQLTDYGSRLRLDIQSVSKMNSETPNWRHHQNMTPTSVGADPR